MAQAKLIQDSKELTSAEKKRMGMKENLGNPVFVYEQILQLFKEGDLSSTTDFISAYVANSHKYKNQDAFAEAIGSNRQTLHRMFANENVSMNLYFKAIEQIFDDSQDSSRN